MPANTRGQASTLSSPRENPANAGCIVIPMIRLSSTDLTRRVCRNQLREFRRGQTGAPVSLHFPKPAMLDPVLTRFSNFLTRTSHEVPPHHNWILERLAADQEQTRVG